MLDNASAHAPEYTCDWLKKIDIKDDKWMKWPHSSANLNPIENLWSLLKKDAYVSKKEYNSLDELWNSIVIAASYNSKESIKV